MTTNAMNKLRKSVNPAAHIFDFNQAQNKLVISFSGFYDADGIDDFFKTYARETKSINKPNTTVVLDAVKLSTFAPDVLEGLIKAFHEYTNYKKIFLVKSTNGVANNQFMRLLRAGNILEKFHFVDSLVETR